ncbi:MAG: hypothetical protein AB1797_08920 [bacterium]
MLYADLYQRKIELDRYVREKDCRACGFHSREDFLEKLHRGDIRGEGCISVDPQRLKALQLAARPDEILPKVKVLQLPAPAPPGIFPLNHPDPDSPVLVSGNSQLTIEVLLAVLATTVSPFWYLVVDTDGHTVDMALIYQTLTAERILNALTREAMDQKVTLPKMVIPGLAVSLQEEIANLTGWSVQVGPICAVELPLYFGPAWQIESEVR